MRRVAAVQKHTHAHTHSRVNIPLPSAPLSPVTCTDASPGSSSIQSTAAACRSGCLIHVCHSENLSDLWRPGCVFVSDTKPRFVRIPAGMFECVPADAVPVTSRLLGTLRCLSQLYLLSPKLLSRLKSQKTQLSMKNPVLPFTDSNSY